MSSKVSNAALRQLLAAISEPALQQRVRTLIEASIDAVTAISGLDENIFALRKQLSTDNLQEVADKTLGPVRRLGRYLEFLRKTTGGEETPPEGEEIEFDFDMGPSDPQAEQAALTLDEEDIEDAFEMIASDEGQSSQEKWAELHGDIDSLSYALGSKLRDFDERFAEALEEERFSHALRELDDVGSSLIDGVFALMTAVYEGYLGEVDPDSFIPGHRDTLSRALLIRRSLTDLRRAVSAQNQVAQSQESGAADQERAVAAIAQELDEFISSDVFALMRSQDRGEFTSFQSQLAQKPLGGAKLSCEGLDKYLDSLAVVNQRDVLIQHDTTAKEDITEFLEGVQPILDISPHGAVQMVVQAFARAKSLYGLHDQIDELLGEWAKMDPEEQKDPQAAARMGSRLQALVAPPRKPAASGDDFF